MKHDIKKLPKWAQALLEDKDKRYTRLEECYRRLSTAHALLMNKEWFTIPGPFNKPDDPDVYNLYILRTNTPVLVCTLGRNDQLLCGRGTKKPKDTP
jgi:hypothetical protein